MPTIYTTSVAILSSCGPEDPYRFTENRLVDLISLLPNHLKDSEVNDLTQFFQDFLNTMYFEKKYRSSATSVEIENRPKISILEKINRLAELHDPDLVDVEYLQYFANYLGYNVDISKGELGILENQDSTDPCTQEDVNRYLRFVVSNLPNWYRIKTTRNAAKVMLYSFGLIGDILQYFTSDYLPDDGTNWVLYKEADPLELALIPSNFYPTSHFSTVIDLDLSEIDVSLDTRTRNSVVKALNSIRPVNTVFEGITGYVKPPAMPMNYAILSRTNLFMIIKSD